MNEQIEALAKSISKKSGVVIMRLYISGGKWYASTVQGDYMVSDLLKGAR